MKYYYISYVKRMYKFLILPLRRSQTADMWEKDYKELADVEFPVTTTTTTTTTTTSSKKRSKDSRRCREEKRDKRRSIE